MMSLGQLATGCLRLLEDTSWADGTLSTLNIVCPALVSMWLEETVGASRGLRFFRVLIRCSPGDTH